MDYLQLSVLEEIRVYKSVTVYENQSVLLILIGYENISL